MIFYFTYLAFFQIEDFNKLFFIYLILKDIILIHLYIFLMFYLGEICF